MGVYFDGDLTTKKLSTKLRTSHSIRDLTSTKLAPTFIKRVSLGFYMPPVGTDFEVAEGV